MKLSKVCVLRVDDEGNQYRGYIADMSDDLFRELGIDKEYTESTVITDEIRVINNKESVVRGYRLNRAVYDVDGNLRTVLGGNIIVLKIISDRISDISLEDMAVIEDRLRVIAAISHGFVFTKNFDELLKWKND